MTDSMHTRKALMFEEADAFVSLPGGLGTLDETIEIITWRQLGLHDRPVLIANLNGWATGLIAVLNGFVTDGFADAVQPRLVRGGAGCAGGAAPAADPPGPASAGWRDDCSLRLRLPAAIRPSSVGA